MKILFFIESLCSGGKERRLLELAHYLKFKANYEVAIVLLKNEIHYDYVFNWGIPISIIQRKGLKRDPRLFFKFFKICYKFSPDIIHTWGIINTFYAIPSKLLLKIPIVTSMITNAKSSIKKWSLGKFYFKTSCYFSNSIISNSKAGVDAYRLKGKKVKVIYNGVNSERFEIKFNKKKIRNDLEVNTKFMIVMVASVNSNKNYNLFLDVAKETFKKNKDITFIGVGDGPEFNRISTRIAEEQIENVLLIGSRLDIESVVYSSDIGVLFSYCESFPNSVMEYMGLKKPVIVSDVGGTKELVKDAKMGFLISNKDLDDICNKILFLIENPEIRKSMGQSGYTEIKNNFSIDRMSLSFIKTYKSLLRS